jgi:UDP-N-acetylglucosamine:LPS N-acetylglucosamine transferase
MERSWKISKKTQVIVNCGSLGSASVHTTLLSLFKKHADLLNDFSWTVLLWKLNLDYQKEYADYPEVKVYEFVDQAVMGDLYLSHDVSICRGGSTTLVEQQIFGLKQIIIPIPWTHDQSKNAQYFARHYQDIVIDQQQNDRAEQLYQSILSLYGFKKKLIQSRYCFIESSKLNKKLSRVFCLHCLTNNYS